MPELLFKGDNCCDTWDDVCAHMEKAMALLLEGAPFPYYWVAVNENFGWCNLSGGTWGPKHVTNGGELLFAILPKTDCAFNVFLSDDKKEIIIQNFHHDNQTGKEKYYIRAASEKEMEDAE